MYHRRAADYPALPLGEVDGNYVAIDLPYAVPGCTEEFCELMNSLQRCTDTEIVSCIMRHGEWCPNNKRYESYWEIVCRRSGVPKRFNATLLHRDTLRVIVQGASGRLCDYFDLPWTKA